MFDLNLVVKSSTDKWPTINTSSLIKAGVLKKVPAVGTKIELGFVNAGGVHFVQDFYATRSGTTLAANKGYNFYLLDLPSLGNPTVVGCTGLACKAVGRSATVAAKKRSAPKAVAAPVRSSSKKKATAPAKTYGKLEISLNELKLALREGSTAGAAFRLDVSVDTVRRAKAFFGI